MDSLLFSYCIWLIYILNVCSGASPDNTTIPPASSIVDNSGKIWTLSSGYIYVNGVKLNGPYNVAQLIWYSGSVTQKNYGGDFYTYTGSGWKFVCLDPRIGPWTADGTTIPSASYITDKLCNNWTLSNGYIYKNGVQDPYAYNVQTLLWYGGMIYHIGTGGQFYVLPFHGKWLKCSDPRIAKAANSGSFYGINGHYDYYPAWTPSIVVSTLQALGCTIYRINTNGNSTLLNPTVSTAKAFQSAGLKLFPVITYGLKDSNGNLYQDEQTAYNAVKSGAAAVATALQPYGVNTYEAGNELTRDSAIITNSATAGNLPIDFNNTNWPILRGVIRGMIDGVKSVQPSARVGVNFCVADVAAADMLWEGTQPNGSAGYTQVRWDITTWHNYSPNGGLFNIGTDGAGPGFNLPVYAKARYGVPFWITEWNHGPTSNETVRSEYVQQQLTDFYNARQSNAIESTMLYELIGGDGANLNYGIVSTNNTNIIPIQPTYDTFKNFIKQHPDN